MTAPAHVLVFRPIVERLRERGHEVELTARDYSQTVELLHMHGLHATVFGRHGHDESVRAIVIPRTEAQREYVRNLNLPWVVVPDGAVDAQSLIALADLVISAGGTM